MNWPSGWAWLADRHYAWCQAAYLRCSGQSAAGHGCWCRLNSGRAWERTSGTLLLLHELAHLKRRDHWVRWLELVVAGLYWWHPVVWWARRALREAEEQCCDAWVVWAMPDRSRTYASCLTGSRRICLWSPNRPGRRIGHQR